jgi:hypothetical protein
LFIGRHQEETAAFWRVTLGKTYQYFSIEKLYLDLVYLAGFQKLDNRKILFK